MGTSYTACKNIVDCLNGIFTNVAGFGFDSRVFHCVET